MLGQICVPIQGDLKRVEEVLASELVSGIDKVDALVRHVMDSGGKRIRPAVFLLAAAVAGAGRDDRLPRLAAAMEMVHTASILHDDVVDDAPARRGRISARARWGNQMSVLVGDFLWCRASGIIMDYGSQRLIDAVSGAVEATTMGELLEIARQSDTSIDIGTYMEIVKGKTAALFSVAARAGAIVAGVGKPFESALSQFGDRLGQAFQLTDDVLDYVADEGHFGKRVGTDLREGKITYPLIVALGKATTDEARAVKGALIAGHSSPGLLGEVASIIDRYGGVEAARRLACELAQGSKECLSAFRPSMERDALIGLADYVVDRKE